MMLLASEELCSSRKELLSALPSLSSQSRASVHFGAILRVKKRADQPFWAAGGISIWTCDALRVDQVVRSKSRKWASEQHKRAGQVRFWPTTRWPCWQQKSCLDSERGGSVCTLSLVLSISVACQQGVSDISVYSLCFWLADWKEKGGEGAKDISYNIHRTLIAVPLCNGATWNHTMFQRCIQVQSSFLKRITTGISQGQHGSSGDRKHSLEKQREDVTVSIRMCAARCSGGSLW